MIPMGVLGSSRYAATGNDFVTQLLAASPTACWLFTEASGTVYSEVGGYTGSVTGGTYQTSTGSPSGSEIYINAGQISTNYVPGVIEDFSIEALMRTTDVNGVIAHSRVADSNLSMTMNIGNNGGSTAPNGAVQFGLDSGGIWQGIETNTVTVHDGFWHHVVGVWDGTSSGNYSASQLSIYVDGVVTAVTATSIGAVQSVPFNNSGAMRISAHSLWGVNGPLTATYGAMGFFERALTAGEILDRAQAAGLA